MQHNDSAVQTTASCTAALIGDSAVMHHLRDLILRVARSNASVMLIGPSGSGKELVARAIHAASTRSGHAFSAVNCGAIPAELIESELFGHEKGAFTGAINRRIGHFETSHRGSIFLDEIGDMRFDMQVKLLRVLEDRTIMRVGSSEARAVDIRVISATHQDLPSAIERRAFREDLFFRLGVVVLPVPALNSRLEDIPALIRHFQADLPHRDRCVFGNDALAVLMDHSWPGNVRELRNLVERAGALYRGERVDAAIAAMLLNPAASLADLQGEPGRLAGGAATNQAPILACGQPIDLKREIEAIELEQIHVALDLADGIIADAARLLTLKRTTLVEKMRKYGVQQQAA